MLDKHTTRLHFERAADHYDASAVLQREIATRLSERLDYIKINPQRVLDLGCGTGYLSQDLLKRYSKAPVIALDLALNMAKKTSQLGGWRRRPKPVCADAEKLPLQTDSIDLIVSNLMLQWSNDLPKTFAGLHRVLAPNGLLLFTTFGPDTLKEIRQSWQGIDTQPHTSTFVDMHDIGDALLQAGFINPVMDMEMITMTYKDVKQLMRDIKQIGASNTDTSRAKGLMGKAKLQQFMGAYEQFKTAAGLYPATWEIIYGHAWVGEGIKLENYDNVIPLKLET